MSGTSSNIRQLDIPIKSATLPANTLYSGDLKNSLKNQLNEIKNRIEQMTSELVIVTAEEEKLRSLVLELTDKCDLAIDIKNNPIKRLSLILGINSLITSITNIINTIRDNDKIDSYRKIIKNSKDAAKDKEDAINQLEKIKRKVEQLKKDIENETVIQKVRLEELSRMVHSKLPQKFKSYECVLSTECADSLTNFTEQYNINSVSDLEKFYKDLSLEVKSLTEEKKGLDDLLSQIKGYITQYNKEYLLYKELISDGFSSLSKTQKNKFLAFKSKIGKILEKFNIQTFSQLVEVQHKYQKDLGEKERLLENKELKLEKVKNILNVIHKFNAKEHKNRKLSAISGKGVDSSEIKITKVNSSCSTELTS